jgi:hypothetical protein
VMVQLMLLDAPSVAGISKTGKTGQTPRRSLRTCPADGQWRGLCWGPVRWWRVALGLGLLGIGRSAS